MNFHKLLPNFETEAQAKRESRKRRIVLENSHRLKDRKLAAKHARCWSKDRCGSAACSVCFREHRKRMILLLVALSNRPRKAYILTLIIYEGLTNNQLFKVDVAKYKRRLWRQLNRAGFTEPVLGSLEFDYHTEIKMWLPHFHLLVLGSKKPIKELKKRFYSNIKPIPGRSTGIYRPVHTEKLKDKGPQLSYLVKSYWGRVEAYTPPNGKRRTRKYRLKPNELRLSLRVLDRLGFKGLLFHYKVGLVGNKYVVAVNEKY